MSLNDMSLDPVLLQDLYKNTLVDIASKKAKTTKPQGSFSFLGNNKKGIAIIVSSKEAIHLADDELSFLLGILSACKLTMEDVAIMNIEKNNQATYQTIEAELKAKVILLFGVSTDQIQLPIQFPDYQIQKYNSQVYLSAPILGNIEKDKAEKIKLWNSLKQVFSIT